MQMRAFGLLSVAVAIGVALGAAAPAIDARGGHTRASAGAWCGRDSSATDRTPDAANTFQWHVTYAVPADSPDRFSHWVDAIVGDHTEIHQWFKGQDPARELRYDFHDFAGCDAGFGRLDISHVRLREGGSAYAGNTFERVAREVSGGNWDLWDHKRYVIYYDGPTTAPVCGGAGGVHAMLFLSRPGCPFDRDGYRRWVAGHEMTHVLAEPLPLGTPWVDLPHACSDRVHVCDDGRDIIAGRHATDLAGRLLDAGRDDYYGHTSGRWDAQDSPFLERLDLAPRPQVTAPVRFSVTSDPDARFTDDVPVVLTWTPAGGGAGPIRYRVRRNAAFVVGTDGGAMKPFEARSFRDRGAENETVAYTLYAFDPLGYMARPVSVRFRIGVGIVDDAGKLRRDTVPPARVDAKSVRATKRSGRLLITWRPVRDRVAPPRYRMQVASKTYVVARAMLQVAAPKASRLPIVVRAVDRAGNVGRPSRTVIRLRG